MDYHKSQIAHARRRKLRRTSPEQLPKDDVLQKLDDFSSSTLIDQPRPLDDVPGVKIFFVKMFSRMFHWGTLLAQFIISSVSLTFLYCNTYFYPVTTGRGAVDFGGFVHLLIFCLTSVLTQYNFIMAIFIGPGYVPRRWIPENSDHVSLLQYCAECKGYKAPRAHHCRKCGRCVSKMEHHCPWINNCVGHRNHAYFLRFLFFAVLGCAHAFGVFALVMIRIFTYLYMDSVYRRHSGQSSSFWTLWSRFIYFLPPPGFFTLSGLLWLVTMIGFAFGVAVAVGALFVIQFRIILKNETSIENWIIDKANYYLREEAGEADRSRKPKPFLNPYDLGWTKNLEQVIFNRSQNPVGDGIWWPVIDGNQFTLTAEQLRQKQLKHDSSVIYIVREPYNGRLFPIFSQGLMVCLTFPWTVDEPRIDTNPGEHIRVTRFQKRWLYGTKIGSQLVTASQDGDQDSETFRTMSDKKGWFPRRVAVKWEPKISELN